MKPARRDRLNKIAVIVTGLMLIFYGAAGILADRSTYSNYWGGRVFAPFAILVGALFIYIVIFHWKAFNKPRVDKKGRRIRFPADDFRKW
jgi:hypothetical protein